jgi:CheY-like chemotaxis protein
MSFVVIIFTSSTSEREIQAAYELGANSVVLKPGDIPERIELARHFKTWWLGLNQFAP